ncbi:excalibur calcium-binding domain-containing protein [Aeromonas veronii]|uniref:excalibur calcium-binding domain-containing protein n=1 Tax=Aeromonas veronii TaxID=654 RepID=UPI0022312C84|nr:excalibur calcium-binding domain-containing protein [Aeromonas veronii]MDX7876284.1 excalibur calcium-binding domain-containing protein [Aeromonas veronii]UZE60490.1 excalibur calcium-binding domain-containing protein [Aeromonas veronii]
MRHKAILLSALLFCFPAFAAHAVEQSDPKPQSEQSVDNKKQSKQGFSCSTVARTCSQMSSCEEAEFALEQCGRSRLDRDKDGIPCENVCE